MHDLSNIDISVVIACHNEGRLLERCVLSVLRQAITSNLSYDIVLVPDNPDSITEQVVQQFEHEPRISVIHNHGRNGPGGARDTGINACRGEWIALLDGDDEMASDSLTSRWRIVEEQGEEVSLIGGDVELMSLDGHRTTSFNNSNVPVWLKEKADGADYVRLVRPVELLCDVQILHTNGMMFRKSLYLTVGGFHRSLWRGEDTHMWIQLASEADLYFLPQIVAYHYRRANSISEGKDPDQVWSRRAFELLLRQRAMGPHRSAIRRRLARINGRLCNIYRQRNAWGPAVVCAIQALRWDIKKPASWKLLIGSILRRH